jgi:hypothetical protein
MFIALSVYLGVETVGCSNDEPPYLSLREKAEPKNAFPVAVLTEGPFTRQMLELAVVGNTQIAVTEAPQKGTYAIFISNDFINWNIRQVVSARPKIAWFNDRVYWSDNGQLASLGLNFEPSPLRQNLPSDITIRGLTPTDDSLLVAANSNVIYKLTESGQWSNYAEVPSTEKIVSLAASGSGFCAVSADTRKIWLLSAPGAAATFESMVPPDDGAILQLSANTQHSFLLTDNMLLVGDRNCQNWSKIPDLPDAGELYSVAVGAYDTYLTAQHGLFKFDGLKWDLIQTMIGRAMVQRLKAIKGRLYACHLGGLDISDDFGGEWKPSNIPVSGSEAVSDVTEHLGVIYAATDRGLFRQDTGGHTWERQILPANAPQKIATVASNGSSLVVAGPDSPDPRNATILIQDAGSQKWQGAMRGLEDARHIIPIITIAGKFFVPTDRGLFKYDDRGSGGLPILSMVPQYRSSRQRPLELAGFSSQRVTRIFGLQTMSLVRRLNGEASSIHQ